MVLKLGVLLLAVAGAAGCKGGVVSPGEVSWELTAGLVALLPKASHPIVGVVWTDPFQNGPDVVMPARRIESTVTTTDTAIAMRFFGPPPPEALHEIPSPVGDVAVMAMGELVVVDDADGDGMFRIDRHGTIATPDGGQCGEAGVDCYLASTQWLIVYVARPFANATNFPIAMSLEPGYHLQRYECAGRIFGALGDGGTSFTFELQTSRTLVERRTCLRTHAP